MAAVAVAYLVCDLVTGRVLTELPLTNGDKIRKQLTKELSTTFTLPVYDPDCPGDWDDLLVNGKSMIVLTLDGTPAQGWVVRGDVTYGDVTVPITASTLEHCLASTNVPELDPTGLDESQVAALLMAELDPRFGFDVDWQPCGKVDTGDETYSSEEDRWVLDAVNALNAADGGPEWRIVLGWADATHRVVTKTVQIRKTIGTLRRDAIFDLDADGTGSIESYQRVHGYGPGKGATMMIGTSEGSGSTRPMTDPYLSTLVDAGWPVWEERKNFTNLADAEDEDSELANRTVATLTQRQRGQVTWTVSSRTLRPGVDYEEGDTVPLQVAPQPPRDPKGGTASLRVIGWELDPKSGEGSPIFLDPGDDTDG